MNLTLKPPSEVQYDVPCNVTIIDHSDFGRTCMLADVKVLKYGIDGTGDGHIEVIYFNPERVPSQFSLGGPRVYAWVGRTNVLHAKFP
jgi:hypothetical protein